MLERFWFPVPMCASFESNGKQFRPGRIVAAWREERADSAVWGGFARSEILAWWLGKGFKPVDVPAERFAERSRRDGRLHWSDTPPGLVIRGLWDASGAMPQVWIVTRQATPVELEVFGHDRMPLLESPLFSSELIPMEPEPERPSNQLELF